MTQEKTPQDLWRETLTILKSRLTKSTFETCLLGSRFLRLEADCFVIGLRSATALSWLAGRLQGKVEQALRQVVGREIVTVTFELLDETAVEPVPLPPQPLPGSATTRESRDAHLVRGIDFHKLWNKNGFGQVPHYVSEFWIPYLKPNTFALWKYLDALDKRDIRRPEHRWTPPTSHYQTHLANRLGYRGRRAIAGGLIECSRAKNARLRGEPLAECCGLHPVHLLKQAPDSQPGTRCYYWGEGALEVLYREKLLALEIDPRAKTGNRKMRLQLWRLFPILTPRQVSRLTPYLQEVHQRWLQNHQAILGLTLSEWEQIDSPTLAPLMVGYAEHRKLFGHYQFNRILAVQKEMVLG